MTLSQSLEDYLETILILSEEDESVRVRDVAERLGVKKPSVVAAVKSLVEKDLINHERYGSLRLTPAGSAIAHEVYHRHKIIYSFLNQVLGVDEETAERDACQLEHNMSADTMERLLKFIEFAGALKDDTADPNWLVRFRSYIETGELISCEIDSCKCQHDS